MAIDYNAKIEYNQWIHLYPRFLMPENDGISYEWIAEIEQFRTRGEEQAQTR